MDKFELAKTFAFPAMAMALITDREMSQEESQEIISFINAAGKSMKLTDNEARKCFIETGKLLQSLYPDTEQILNATSGCVSLIKSMSSQDFCEYYYTFLENVAKADRKVTDAEKLWLEMFRNILKIESKGKGEKKDVKATNKTEIAKTATKNVKEVEEKVKEKQKEEIQKSSVKPYKTEPKVKEAEKPEDSPNKPASDVRQSLQYQLSAELLKLYPDAIIKKVDVDNYCDIHVPKVHPKRGTHLFFNTPSRGSISVGFFCRDDSFVENVLNKNPETIEKYSNGIRIKGNPDFYAIGEAIAAADKFIKEIIKS